jgi:hypothetical protein
VHGPAYFIRTIVICLGPVRYKGVVHANKLAFLMIMLLGEGHAFVIDLRGSINKEDRHV